MDVITHTHLLTHWLQIILMVKNYNFNYEMIHVIIFLE